MKSVLYTIFFLIPKMLLLEKYPQQSIVDSKKVKLHSTQMPYCPERVWIPISANIGDLAI